MLNLQNTSIRFGFAFVASATKLGKAGLSPAVTVYRNSSATPIATGTATELANGLYFYDLSSGLNTVDGELWAVAITTDDTVVSKVSYSHHLVGKAGLPNLDAAITSRAPASTALSSATWTTQRATNLDNLDAAITTRSTYAGADPAGVTTLLSRLTTQRGANLDNLDAAITSRQPSGAVTLASGSLTAVADAVLGRDFSAVASPSARSAIHALRLLRNRSSRVGTVLTVYLEDGTTPAWTATLTAAAADPITGISPQ